MTSQLSPNDAVKRALRAEAALVRRIAHQALHGVAGPRIAAHALAAPPLRSAAVVSGYWPMAEEADPLPLLDALAAEGRAVALPVVVGRHRPLEFRQWRPGDPLEPGGHGTRHPLAQAAVLVPDLLLVPLLAFDRQGSRLGYGGGYYDRTLAMLRASGPAVAMGLAYAAQEVAALPRDGHDQHLDWVVTEEGLHRCGEERL
jgi:5-formyltetrahydrofolate cyclo-ligase